MSCDTLLARIAAACCRSLGKNLTGVYVHGSIAFGCFCWESSDVDFLVVAKEPPAQQEKVQLIQGLLDLEGAAPPKGLEMSVVLEQYCRDFVYPTPFELHFSSRYLEACRAGLERFCAEMNGVDKDLAAHFTVVRAVGVAICGKPVPSVFGDVPKAAYLDSIAGDVKDAQTAVASNPVYVILNLCRVAAFMRNGAVLSKAQGGHWGMKQLPALYAPVIKAALGSYRSGEPFMGDRDLARSFAQFMIGQIFPPANAAK